jgi:hypothetical protein
MFFWPTRHNPSSRLAEKSPAAFWPKMIAAGDLDGVGQGGGTILRRPPFRTPSTQSGSVVQKLTPVRELTRTLNREGRFCDERVLPDTYRGQPGPATVSWLAIWRVWAYAAEAPLSEAHFHHIFRNIDLARGCRDDNDQRPWIGYRMLCRWWLLARYTAHVVRASRIDAIDAAENNFPRFFMMRRCANDP